MQQVAGLAWTVNMATDVGLEDEDLLDEAAVNVFPPPRRRRSLALFILLVLGFTFFIANWNLVSHCLAPSLLYRN